MNLLFNTKYLVFINSQLQQMDIELNFETLFYIGAGITILYMIYQSCKQPEFKPVDLTKNLIKKDMTFQQLKKYDSQTGEKILVALKGKIYDVSSSDFYKKGSAYQVFGGHDASINLAKMSHQTQYLDKFGQINLDQQQQKTLNDWAMRFEMKYPYVGKIIK